MSKDPGLTLQSSCGEIEVQILSLVVVEPTHLKNMLVKLDHVPKDRGENKPIFQTTTGCYWDVHAT